MCNRLCPWVGALCLASCLLFALGCGAGKKRLGEICQANSECASGSCESGRCAQAPTTSDATDVDFPDATKDTSGQESPGDLLLSDADLIDDTILAETLVDSSSAPEVTLCTFGTNLEITVDTIWGPEIIRRIDCQVTVMNNATLQLLANTEVRFTDKGGVIVENGSAFQADGSAGQIRLVVASGSTYWDGLRFNPNADGSKIVIKKTLIDRAGHFSGASNQAAVTFDKLSGFTFDENTVTNSERVGVRLTGVITPASFSGNTITGHGRWPIEVHAENAHVIGPGTYNSIEAGYNSIRLYATSSPLQKAVTWANHGIPYLLDADLTATGTQPSPAVLTLADGVVIEANAKTMRFATHGGLIAEAQTTIRLVATTAAGLWGGLRFKDAAGSQIRIKGVEIRNAGRLDAFTNKQGAIVIQGLNEPTQVVIANNLIRGGEGQGLIFEVTQEIPVTAPPLITGNTITQFPGHPIVIAPKHVHLIGANTFEVIENGLPVHNGEHSIHLRSSVEADRQWKESFTLTNPGIPYHTENELRIVNGATVTIASGVTIKFADGFRGLQVGANSGLIVDGTENNPVSFSDVSQATPTGWAGVGFNGADGAKINLSHLLVQGAGKLSQFTNMKGSIVFQDMINGDQLKLTSVTVNGGESPGFVFDSVNTVPTTMTKLSVVMAQDNAPSVAVAVKDLTVFQSFTVDLVQKPFGDPAKQHHVRVYGTTPSASTLQNSATLPNLGVPYRFDNQLIVSGQSNNPVSLVIAPGATLLFDGGVSSSHGLFIDAYAGLKVGDPNLGCDANLRVLFGLYSGDSWVGLRFDAGADYSLSRLTCLTIDAAGVKNIVSGISISVDASLGLMGVQNFPISDLTISNAKGTYGVYLKEDAVDETCPTTSKISISGAPTPCGTDVQSPAPDCCPNF